jgi:hypothetical protein
MQNRCKRRRRTTETVAVKITDQLRQAGRTVLPKHRSHLYCCLFEAADDYSESYFKRFVP